MTVMSPFKNAFNVRRKVSSACIRSLAQRCQGDRFLRITSSFKYFDLQHHLNYVNFLLLDHIIYLPDIIKITLNLNRIYAKEYKDSCT